MAAVKVNIAMKQQMKPLNQGSSIANKSMNAHFFHTDNKQSALVINAYNSEPCSHAHRYTHTISISHVHR